MLREHTSSTAAWNSTPHTSSEHKPIRASTSTDRTKLRLESVEKLASSVSEKTLFLKLLESHNLRELNEIKVSRSNGKSSAVNSVTSNDVRLKLDKVQSRLF